MTNISSHIAVGHASAPADIKRHIARRALEIALRVVIAAARAGAWLAFFTFIPFDFRVR